MRKLTIVIFALLAIMMMTMPAYAQGGTAAPANNLVPIAAGFGIAIAAGLAGLRTGPGRRRSLRGHGPKPCCTPGDPSGPDSGSCLHRVAGAVHPGYHLRQGRIVLGPWLSFSAPSAGRGVLPHRRPASSSLPRSYFTILTRSDDTIFISEDFIEVLHAFAPASSALVTPARERHNPSFAPPYNTLVHRCINATTNEHAGQMSRSNGGKQEHDMNNPSQTHGAGVFRRCADGHGFGARQYVHGPRQHTIQFLRGRSTAACRTICARGRSGEPRSYPRR